MKPKQELDNLKSMETSDVYWMMSVSEMAQKGLLKERKPEYDMKLKVLKRFCDSYGFKWRKVWKTEAGCRNAIRRLEERGLTKGDYVPSEVMFLKM